eukprot:15416012-Alexandrium_andersonii.AAC.1
MAWQCHLQRSSGRGAARGVGRGVLRCSPRPRCPRQLVLRCDVHAAWCGWGTAVQPRVGLALRGHLLHFGCRPLHACCRIRCRHLPVPRRRPPCSAAGVLVAVGV